MGDIDKHTNDETQDAQNQARRTSGWAIAALVLGLAAGMTLLIIRAQNMTAESRQSCCLSNLKSMAHAQLMYAQDYDGRFPPVDHWPKALYGPYLKNCQILTCPARDQAYAVMNHGGEIIYSGEVSYSMNVFLSGLDQGTLGYPDRTPLEFDGTQVAGGPEVAAYRHRNALNLSYADGHAKYLNNPEFLQLCFEPPPT